MAGQAYSPPGDPKAGLSGLAVVIKRDASISNVPASGRHPDYQTAAVISIKEEVEGKIEMQEGYCPVPNVGRGQKLGTYFFLGRGALFLEGESSLYILGRR